VRRAAAMHCAGARFAHECGSGSAKESIGKEIEGDSYGMSIKSRGLPQNRAKHPAKHLIYFDKGLLHV
jgi:hypothetical protein